MAKRVVSERMREALLAAIVDPDGPGRRGLLALPEVRAFAHSPTMMSLVSPHLSAPASPVRAIFFDKSPTSNWLVPWHQDVTIAVSHQAEISGYGPWSLKDGIPHVQPPDAFLSQMITVRIHLDDCDASNGALRVIPGSHKQGRLAPHQIATAKSLSQEVVCEASAGDALLMRPLLLHASSKSVSHRRRRILHVEYCSADLPPGLAWHDAA